MSAWITFDCFGTLVDWHAGFTSILTPLAGERTTALLNAYHLAERVAESEQPHRRYRNVLAASLLRAARDTGVTLSEDAATVLGDSWDRLTTFPDVEPMLAALRALNFRVGVLTNCDDDLFAQTQRRFARPFDMVVTAEQVGSYKPALTHFRRFAEAASPSEWIHVACSWYHDISPARQLGLTSIWLDRDDTGDDPAIASARVRSADEVAATVARLR